MKVEVVIDRDSDGIIYRAPTYTNAYAVASGIPAAYAATLVCDKVADILGFKPVRTPQGIHVFHPMRDEQRTEEFLLRKRLAKARGIALYSIELFMERYLNRTHDFYDSSLDSFLAYSLLASGQDSPAVKEYAAIQEIPLLAAYNELKLRLENHGMMRLKNFATFKKYVHRINTKATQEDIEAELQAIRSENFSWASD